ncbi:hypothetical protein HBB16_05405 [Pseudonocardia sp. MCCB 268]|nr:hypothetical protein [Pseudonocardia cytotoxica]
MGARGARSPRRAPAGRRPEHERRLAGCWRRRRAPACSPAEPRLVRRGPGPGSGRSRPAGNWRPDRPRRARRRVHRALFSESAGRVLVTVVIADAFSPKAAEAGVPAARIGETGGTALHLATPSVSWPRRA